MKLYYAPNTISVAAAITLEESGLEHQFRLVDFSKDEQNSADYTAINPKGRVPALQTGGTMLRETGLTETGAILEYIAALCPALMPTDPVQAARARSVMYYLASTMHVNHAHGKRGQRWADNAASWADMTAKVPRTMAASAAHVEAQCIDGPYVLGATFCIADAYLFTVCTWLTGDGVDVHAYPKIQSFMTMMDTRKSVQAVRAKGMLP
jgi:glutathione S-transferase